MERSFHVNSLFIGPNVRGAVQSGQADFTPVFLHEIPRLFRDGHLPLDVALISVSPPDQHGFCSFGVEVGVTKPAAESASIVIAEINPQMPRVWGNSFIHLDQISYCVPVDYPLPQMAQGESSPLPGFANSYRQIASYITDLIMVAINSALQIDLTGQVCADSIGCKFYSGVGGQADFMRGAARSRGGKPIIALPSTALGGKVSSIVATLDPGAGVTTTRNDVHYVVTEYGVAQLYGKSVRQRAEVLIGIAHPDFREELRRAAHNRCLL